MQIDLDYSKDLLRYISVIKSIKWQTLKGVLRGKQSIFPWELSYNIKYPPNYDFVLFVPKVKVLNLFLSELLVVNLLFLN